MAYVPKTRKLFQVSLNTSATYLVYAINSQMAVHEWMVYMSARKTTVEIRTLNVIEIDGQPVNGPTDADVMAL